MKNFNKTIKLLLCSVCLGCCCQVFAANWAIMGMKCTSKEVRTRSLALYSGPKLGGEMLTSEGVFNQWQVAPPNSPVFNIMRSLCENH